MGKEWYISRDVKVFCSYCDWKGVQNISGVNDVNKMAAYDPGKCPDCDSSLILGPIPIDENHPPF